MAQDDNGAGGDIPQPGDKDLATTDNSQNGAKGYPRAMSDDMFPIGFGGAGRWNPAEEMFKGGFDPAVYLPRARLEKYELARDVRILALHNQLVFGHSNLAELTAVHALASIGVDGQARREVVEIATGQPRQRREGGIYERVRDMNNQEHTMKVAAPE